MDYPSNLLYYLIMQTTELALLHGSHTAVCRARVDKHFEGYYTLQFMEEGCLELFYGEQRHVLEGSWFWPAYPGPRVRFHAGPGHEAWNHRYIAFTGPLANRWAAEGLYPAGPQPAPDRAVAVARFDEMLAHFQRIDRWSRLKAVNLLERILIDLAEARHEPAPGESWLREVLDALNEGAGFSADYAAMARRLGMSLSSLRRKFRRAAGVSIHRYTVQARITRARHWLGESDLPVKAIAEKLGYPDVYFFSRQFKAETGTTPTLFRRSRLG